MNQLLFLALIVIAVVFIMLKQINKVTDNIDAKAAVPNNNKYPAFSALIQEAVRAIKADIDHTKSTPNPVYVLKYENAEEDSLEFLSDCIRKLVFFETINSQRTPSSEIEKGLFDVLNDIDNFLDEKIVNGEELSDKLRDELASKFQALA